MENNINNIYLKISMIGSLLNEYYKDESLFKACNLIDELLDYQFENQNMDIENFNDDENSVNLLLPKIMECYCKCDNKTRFVLNNLLSNYKTKFGNCFVNKDIINNINAIITCSDNIARAFALELLFYLPECLLNKRIDLLHSLFELFISKEKTNVLHEERFLILQLFENIILKNDYLMDLLINNYELIIKNFGDDKNNEDLKKIYFKLIKV